MASTTFSCTLSNILSASAEALQAAAHSTVSAAGYFHTSHNGHHNSRRPSINQRRASTFAHPRLLDSLKAAEGLIPSRKSILVLANGQLYSAQDILSVVRSNVGQPSSNSASHLSHGPAGTSLTPLFRSTLQATRNAQTGQIRRAVHPSKPPLRQFSSFSFGSDSRKLDRLEEYADSNPSDASAQAAYYEEALRQESEPSAIIERVECRRFAMNAECLAAYIEALVRSRLPSKLIAERVQEYSNATVSQGSGYGYSRGQSNAPGWTEHSLGTNFRSRAEFDHGSEHRNAGWRGYDQGHRARQAQAGTKDQPFYVIASEGTGISLRKAFFSLLKIVFGLFFFFTGVLVILENQGIFRSGGKGGIGGRFQPEIKPSHNDTVKFEDVAGVDDAKEELQDVVQFIRDPAKFAELGGKMPKGILLTGPPGTGKTLLGRAIAGEAKVPFFFMSGSEFDEVFVGVGARRVRDLFQAARRHAPAIVFIDELDAIGGKRSPKDQNYMRQTLNQLLVDLDGTTQNEGVVLIAATNFPQLLDKALVRPGRFDKHINVPLPDVQGRVQILKVHTKKIKTAKNLDIGVIARATPGLSGADLANLVNEAALYASKCRHKDVNAAHFEFALDRLLMGAERKSALLTPERKKLVSYHEGGHALVALHTPGAHPLHKVTIIPRGVALGMTVQLPEMDKENLTRKEYLAMLDVCMGGRVAEGMTFGEENITSGASSDLERATSIARLMITKLGFGEKTVGLQSHQDDDIRDLSGQSKQLIENEIRRLLDESYARVHDLLKTHASSLQKLADALTEHETLDREQVLSLLMEKRG